MAQPTAADPLHHAGGSGAGEGSGTSGCSKGRGGDGGSSDGAAAAAAAAATDRAPALLALLRVVRGVPPEALSQQLSTAVSAVVQALGSAYPPLQAEALETFQVSGQGTVG